MANSAGTASRMYLMMKDAKVNISTASYPDFGHLIRLNESRSETLTGSLVNVCTDINHKFTTRCVRRCQKACSPLLKLASSAV